MNIPLSIANLASRHGTTPTLTRPDGPCEVGTDVETGLVWYVPITEATKPPEVPIKPPALGPQLKQMLRLAGAPLANDPAPTPEVLALADKIAEIDSKLSSMASSYGDDKPIYILSAKRYIEKLTGLTGDLEQTRQDMLAILNKKVSGNERR